MSEKLYTQQEVRRLLEAKDREIERLLELSYTDHLTGLYNTRYVEEELKKLIALAKRREVRFQCICVVAVDINDFKTINDTFGHEVGDEVIKFFAQNLKEVTRESDIVVRSSQRGDEFIIIMPFERAKGVASAAKRIQRKLRNVPMKINEMDSINIGSSVGYSYGAISEFDFREALRKADEKMYKEKTKYNAGK